MEVGLASAAPALLALSARAMADAGLLAPLMRTTSRVGSANKAVAVAVLSAETTECATDSPLFNPLLRAGSALQANAVLEASAVTTECATSLLQKNEVTTESA